MYRSIKGPFAANIVNQLLSAEAKNALRPLMQSSLAKTVQPWQAYSTNQRKWSGAGRQTGAASNEPDTESKRHSGDAPTYSNAFDGKESMSEIVQLDESAGRTAKPSGQDVKRAGPDTISLELDLTEKTLINSIILSEVLGKPKCFRKGRW